MGFRLTTRPGHPTFIDLPFELPLESWLSPRFVSPVRGISRHTVRFVAYGSDIYALKEIPDRIAEREYRLLRGLADRGVPVVEAVGVASGRTNEEGEELDGILITKHLQFSLPYRALFSRRSTEDLWSPLLDALAEIFVRVHLAGFFWGDCSLSNTLFRRDAGALSAWLVDAETGEMHDQLSDGQRHYDISIAEENVFGELLDLIASGDLDPDFEPETIAVELPRRYEALWAELTKVEVFAPNERHRVAARLRRLNDLGFDVSEVTVEEEPDGYSLRLVTQVVEPGHHRRRLLTLTGLDVQENQARRLLHDIREYRAFLSRDAGIEVAETVAAFRWLVEVFQPTVDMVSPIDRSKLEPAELYHQIQEHRWFLSEAAGTDVGREAAAADYVAHIIPTLPDERAILPVDPARQS